MTVALAPKPSPDASSGDDRAEAYAAVAPVIDYLVACADAAPSLEDAARVAGLSPAHFQRVFKAGVGVSPKRFQQYLAAGAAKAALREGVSVMEASFAAGLSGPSRLHDLFVVAEAMTPGAYRRRGAGLTIRYGVAPGPFGAALVGVTDEGVCWLSFPAAEGGHAAAEAEMRADFPAAAFVEDAVSVAPVAARAFAFAVGEETGAPFRLHVQGTNFQLKVWDALLRIPLGCAVSYADVARAAGAPKAARAVGAAVGANKISLLIPCHRVVLASGAVHNYRWGAARKRALLAMEAALADREPAPSAE